MHKDNWDDLRFVLAVAQSGSVSAAARALGVNHATVLRRIASFEDRHGTSVFDKSPRGYTIPPDRQGVIDAALEVETAILSVQRLIEGAQAPLRGVVRVTSTDTLCLHALPSILADLHEHAHDLRVDLICSNAHLDLARLDADITVRPAMALPDDLTGARVGVLGFAVYATTAAPERWLGMSGAISNARAATWLAGQIQSEAPTGAADSFVTLREMAATGLGRAVLPCFLGDADPRLHRLGPVLVEASVDIWVASHPDMAEIPRIRAVREHLTQGLMQVAPALAGTA